MPTNKNDNINSGDTNVSPIKKKQTKTVKNKTFFEKIGKTGKTIGAILSFLLAVVGAWGAYKAYTTKKIAGKWKLKFEVKKCNHVEYIGQTHTQITMFNQIENAIEGNGEKWELNGEALPFDLHRKIEYKGHIEGDKFEAIYVLHGRDRDSEGHISVVISPDGKTLKGTYSGTIGNDSGPVTGERMD